MTTLPMVRGSMVLALVLSFGVQAAPRQGDLLAPAFPVHQCRNLQNIQMLECAESVWIKSCRQAALAVQRR